MKGLLAVFLFVAAAAAATVPPRNYHEAIGIPLAEQIRQAEEADINNGARIINGQPAQLGQFPHMGGLLISLASGFTSVCGSSLISNTKLVTAAHCWFDGSTYALSLTVVLGSITVFSGGVRVVTSDVVNHPQYETFFFNHDIAVITIPRVEFNDVIQPVNLAGAGNDFVGEWATVAGFGLTFEGGSISPTLNFVSLQVISNAECAVRYGPFVVIQSTLCTSGEGRNTCSSDSGGPLTIGNQLIGVVSFSGASCAVGSPAGFARVSEFASWIRSQM